MSSPRFTTRSGFTLAFIRSTNARASAGAFAVSLRSLPAKRASGPKCRSVISASVRSTLPLRLRSAEARRRLEPGRALRGPLRRRERADAERVEAARELLAEQ